MSEVKHIDEFVPRYMPDGHWIDKWDREVWIKDSGRHRSDGPAVIYQGGGVSWWLNGDWYYTFEEWVEDNEEITDRQIFLLKLKYG